MDLTSYGRWSLRACVAIKSLGKSTANTLRFCIEVQGRIKIEIKKEPKQKTRDGFRQKPGRYALYSF